MNTTHSEQVKVYIRWMIRRDMAEVLDIEDRTAAWDAWTEEDFLKCLRERNCIGMVAEIGDKVVGFMIYELHKAKLHVLKFAVHPDFQRRGVGRQLVNKMVGKLSSHRRTRITLDVPETGLPAQLFFKAMEFRATRVLRDHCEDGGDSYSMQYDITGSVLPDETDGPVNRLTQYYEENQ